MCVCVPNSINVSGNLVVRTLLVCCDDGCGGQTCLHLLKVCKPKKGHVCVPASKAVEKAGDEVEEAEEATAEATGPTGEPAKKKKRSSAMRPTAPSGGPRTRSKA